ncbi:MAG: hypothetical protein DRO87_11115 [Candidatus Thorarchaeota archaeon]|nr:MAG: hypothetical protein DRO87_11115 [Candidatus Thorarchaeota archaeon]RLI56216.1 MAG: hypothetical protein DRP09_07005 [Candidatus Thorarchaeota archaeon]
MFIQGPTNGREVPKRNTSPRTWANAVGVIKVAINQAHLFPSQLVQTASANTTLAHTPPGIIVESLKYPLLRVSVLASVNPTDSLSIYDFPDAWSGLTPSTILAMRKQLYKFSFTVNAKTLEPSDIVTKLQTLALSVSRSAIEFQCAPLPPSRLVYLGGELPAGPVVNSRDLSFSSQPETSKVAEMITGKDIPASEAVWRLMEYDYSLDQIARMMSVGLLGKVSGRRFIPTRSAYKAVIDSYVNRSIMELKDRSSVSRFTIYSAELHGDVFTVFSQPGDARVDYLRIERGPDAIERGASFEGLTNLPVDSKTSVFADRARFEVYRHLNARRRSSHVTVFHFARSQKNDALGPWVVRAGVRNALESDRVQLDSRENALTVLESFLSPSLTVWAQDTPLGETLLMERHVRPTISLETLG